MNRFLKNKKGVTLLEGLIAIGLLAMVSVSTFSVLLSISRRAKQPDLREDMLLSIEKTNAELQKHIGDPNFNNLYICPVVGLNAAGNPASCMAPIKCTMLGQSFLTPTFTYTVEDNDLESKIMNLLPTADKRSMDSDEKAKVFGTKKTTFNITCQGTGV